MHPPRQQRVLRLPEVKVKTGFGRSTILCPCLYKERGQR
ncbi:MULTISPECIES: AlpA family phage regulatory protein [Shewanella]|uniref:AlpA family phage regulatory protein n=2 Tax=Shewanella TaxID=22 RepID=A0A3N4EA82_9GAMM|nr:AlpA family phage regulatory protein [Shewanella psychromarinicola]AZG37462.1 AlpA family phage regulatory protein [Shewanella psychromarinicola]AZG75218.1 AlpA family phage regulatory protein [Shewanella livingstonensis]RPA31140.1 AlpA family phage regulatory protein [Shewanella psychromarinicola]